MHAPHTTHRLGQGTDVSFVQFHPCAAFEPLWQNHGPITNANKSADSVSKGLQHAPDFAISPLRNGHPVPAIGPLSASILDGAKAGQPVIQHDPIEQFLLFHIAQCPQHPNSVLSLQSKSGVHQLVGQLTGAGEQQKAFCVEIEPPHCLPFSLPQLRQFSKNRWPVLRIVHGDHFTNGLMVGNDAQRRGRKPQFQGFTCQLDLVPDLDPLPHMGGHIVDGDLSLGDQGLHFDARTQARLGQQFMQFGAICLWQQHSLLQQV